MSVGKAGSGRGNGGQTSNLYTLRFPELEGGAGERQEQVDMCGSDCEAVLIGQKLEERVSCAMYSDMASVDSVPVVLAAVEKEDGCGDDVDTMDSAECIAGCDGIVGDEGAAVSEDDDPDSMGTYGGGVCDNSGAELEKQGNRGCCNMDMRKRLDRVGGISCLSGACGRGGIMMISP